MANKICMEKKELVDEHEHLVKTLRKGSKGAQKKEANKQAGELKEYKEHRSSSRKVKR